MAAVFLVLAMASKITWSCVNGATSSPGSALINSTTEAATLESYTDTLYAGDAHPNYPECNALASSIGNGLCDYDSNNAQCGWDGGDCCVCSCVVDGDDDSAGGCTPYMNECKDPGASIEVSKGCVNVSIHVPEVSRCPEDIQFKRIVKNTSDAAMLADTILCSHGNFEVEWRGHVRVNTTILVVNRTNVRIFGNSDAIVDGEGTIQIFLVTNGSLHLSNLRIENGTGAKGGAIIAAAGSEVHTENVIFSSNTAHYVGGAIYAHFSTLFLHRPPSMAITHSTVELSSCATHSYTGVDLWGLLATMPVEMEERCTLPRTLTSAGTCSPRSFKQDILTPAIRPATIRIPMIRIILISNGFPWIMMGRQCLRTTAPGDREVQCMPPTFAR